MPETSAAARRVMLRVGFFLACVKRKRSAETLKALLIKKVFLARFNMSTLFPVVIASGFHLFPFRTEKLSPTAPMVLRKRESRSPPSYFQVEALPARLLGGLFVSLYHVNAALFRRPNAALFRRAGGALPSRLQCSLFCPFGRGGLRAVPTSVLQPQAQ